jgi:nucleoside-diphosphate kinase
MKMLHLTLEQARAFYAVHKERPFFDSLTTFMSSGPIVAMILEGENAIQVNRDLMGATDYRKAAPGTIRADFARDIEANIVHGSDALTPPGRNRLLFQRPGNGVTRQAKVRG